MAAGQGRIQLTMVDGQGLRTSLEIPVDYDDGQTGAQMFAAVQSLAAAVDAISGCQIIRGSFTVVNEALTGLTHTTPDADSRVQEIGGFTYENASNPSLYTVAVPGLLDSKLTSDHRSINTADTAIAAFNTLMLGAVLGGHYANRAYNDFSARFKTFLADRKHRKRLSEISTKLG
jgi:hypothetical protein